MISASTRETPVDNPILHAVIGVWFDGKRTFYVKRSDKMANYPGVWSLFSIQYNPNEHLDSLDLTVTDRLMLRMSQERLYGAPIRVRQFLTVSTCTDNPLGKTVILRLYRVELEREPRLNPDYYTDSRWMNSDEYLQHRGDATCGSCLRMWSDYCKRHGLPYTSLTPGTSANSVM